MNWYKLTVEPKSATATPWQADTIFGHLCWVVLHREGQTALKAFLEPFLAGEPTFLLSDGFPGDLLPRPLTHSIPEATDCESFRAARELRKLSYLPYQDFLRAITRTRPSPDEIPRMVGQVQKASPPSRVTYKNQIDRLTGTTGGEGQLFGFTEYWMTEVTIYLKIRNGHEARVQELFQGLLTSGYGKRKSVGYGAIESLDFEAFHGFPVAENANAFVSLSHFIPAESDPVAGRWRLNVKYGKLGEELATSENPFKRPLVMLVPGSVLYDSPVKEFYGRMVPNVSIHQDVVHYGYALPVTMIANELVVT